MKNFSVRYSKNESNNKDIRNHLERCNELFKPVLSSYIDIEQYSKKLLEKAVRYEIFNNVNLVGLVAVYHSSNVGYISNFSLEQQFLGKDLSSQLMKLCIDDSKRQKLVTIRLEVFRENVRATKFYFKHGFIIEGDSAKVLTLVKTL